MTYEAWSNTLREELDLVFHACQAVFPLMQKRGGGSIINVGSTSGKVAYQVLPGLAHMAAKGGVIAMTKQIAMEGGPHKIRCNTLSPAGRGGAPPPAGHSTPRPRRRRPGARAA